MAGGAFWPGSQKPSQSFSWFMQSSCIWSVLSGPAACSGLTLRSVHCLVVGHSLQSGCSYRVSNQPLSPSVSCLLFRWRRCPFFSCFRSLPLCSHHGIKVTPFIQMTALLVYLGILYIGNFHFLSRKFIIFSVVPFGKCTKNIWWYPQDPQG